MSNIDDLMRDQQEKADVVEALIEAEQGILIIPREGVCGVQVKMFAMTLGDMAFFFAVATALLSKSLLDEDEDV